MKVLIAVVDDLLIFARTTLFGSQPAAVPVVQKQAVPTVDTFVRSLEESLSTATVPEEKTYVSEALLHTGEQYYVGEVEAFVYADPTIAFDNALYQLRYAQPVRLLQIQGRWAQVRIGEQVGWILKDVLCSARRDVLPDFAHAELYTSNHPQTVKLRACIDDEFGGARGDFALTPEEYVYYKLQQKCRRVHWDGERSRLAGTWQRKLKGKPGIYSNIQPKTDAVMEYVVDDMGYVAFVEAVFPDNSIKITEIVTEDGPFYREQTLLPDEWKELRPVFITVA